jgi:MFS transporter, DHA2 family, multidrug resistance protein
MPDDHSSELTQRFRAGQQGVGNTRHDGLPTPRRYLAIVAVSLGTILTTVDGTIVNVALPTLARDLQVSPSHAVLVVTIYQLVMMTMMMPFSALGDRFGFRATYQFGQIIFVAATALCFFARSLPVLVLVRGVQALGAAITLSVSSAMIRSIYPSSRLGSGLSLNTLIAASAASFAPTLGGAILGVAKWPWLFALAVPFGLLSILVGRKSLPQGNARSHSYDVPGAVMCTGTFGIASAGFESAAHGGPWVVTAGLLVLGVALGFVFVRRETGRVRPVFPIDLLRQNKIALSSIGLLAAFVGSMIVMLTLPFRMQQEFHYTPAAAGAVLVPWPLSILAVAPLSGMLSDRIAPGVLGGIGMCIAVAGMISLAFLPGSPNHFDLVWRIAVCGVGFAMYFSPNARQIIGSARIERAAAAGALTASIRQTGQTLGSTAVAAMLAAGIGTGSLPPLIAAAFGLIAGLCSLAVLKPPSRRAVFVDLPEL